MGRPKSKEKFHIYYDKSSPYWKVWYISDETGKKVYRSTKKFKRSDYNKEQVQRMFDSEAGAKRTSQYSIDWLEEHTVYRLELENKSHNTIELYRLAFKYLKSIYGCDFSVMKIDQSVVSDFKMHLLEKEKNYLLQRSTYIWGNLGRLLINSMWTGI